MHASVRLRTFGASATAPRCATQCSAKDSKPPKGRGGSSGRPPKVWPTAEYKKVVQKPQRVPGTNNAKQEPWHRAARAGKAGQHEQKLAAETGRAPQRGHKHAAAAQPRWSMLDPKAYQNLQAWDIPWGWGTTVGGIVAWFLLFLFIGLLQIPLMVYAFDVTDLADVPPLPQSQVMLIDQVRRRDPPVLFAHDHWCKRRRGAARRCAAVAPRVCADGPPREHNRTQDVSSTHCACLHLHHTSQSQRRRTRVLRALRTLRPPRPGPAATALPQRGPARRRF